MKVRHRIAERGRAQREKAIDIPLAQHVLVGVEIDREVEEVGHERDGLAILGRATGLQHVQPLDDQDVRMVDLDPLIGHHVVDEVRVDRCARRALPGLDVGEEMQEPGEIVALRKALLLHQAFALQDRVGIEKTVGGDEVDLGHIRPARQQRLQHARGGRLADRNRPADADDVGHLGVLGAEEFLLHDEEPLRGRHIHGQKARQRQVDLLDLREIEAVVERAQLCDLARLQRHRGVGAQGRPVGAREYAIGRQFGLGTLVHGRTVSP
jgi:hypothetical protein